MKAIFTLLLLISISYTSTAQSYKLNPPRYTCYRAVQPITVDGEIYDVQWQKAPWSTPFRDIRGDDYPVEPKYMTRVKMLWDDQNIYIAAELIEPHIWATLRQRDTVIYHDNDFEVFIDPDGDTHNYFEFEINAFGTEWDLLMTKPYKAGGTFLNGFDIAGLKTKVKCYGSINNPDDTDEKWVVEMSIPFKALVNEPVKAGSQWRMNFSRVEWQKMEIKNGQYAKQSDATGFGNEDNWVWSPTGVVDIHIPEYWGFVQFTNKESGDAEQDFVWNNNEDVKFALRKLLYSQKEYFAKHNKYASSMDELEYKPVKLQNLNFKPTFYPAGTFLKISAPGYDNTVWSITSDSRVWQSK